MKLLLTSTGLSNESLKQSFVGLLDKPVNQCLVAFIPTAANIFGGDKLWVINDLQRFKDLGMEVDIVDISAIPLEMIKKRLASADVLFFEGGSEFYLMKWIEKSRLSKLLPEYLKTKIWVGASAGSMVAGQKLAAASEVLYGEEDDDDKYRDMKSLGLVNFDVLPHLNSESFPNLILENVEKELDAYEHDLYVIDDNTALLVNGSSVEVVSEGKWKKFEKGA
jgi:dipeptidase E